MVAVTMVSIPGVVGVGVGLFVTAGMRNEPLGACVGNGLGTAEGNAVSSTVGEKVGDELSNSDGDAVGTMVGG